MLLNILKLQGIITCWPLEPADELNDWGTNSLLSMRNIASLSGASFPVESIKIKKNLKYQFREILGFRKCLNWLIISKSHVAISLKIQILLEVIPNHICGSWYNGPYTMATIKPIKTLELHYPVSQFLFLQVVRTHSIPLLLYLFLGPHLLTLMNKQTKIFV